MGNANRSSNRNTPYRGIKKEKLKYGGTGCYDSKGNPIPCPSGVKDGSIITSNPKDPRLQAYNDSLTSYNNDVIQNDKVRGLPQTISNSYFDSYSRKLDEDYPINYGLSLKRQQSILRTFNTPNGGELKDYDIEFKKPVQPVIYQKPQQQNKPTTDLYLGAGSNPLWDAVKQNADSTRGPAVFMSRDKFNKLKKQFPDMSGSKPSGRRYLDFGEGQGAGVDIPLYTTPQRKGRISNLDSTPQYNMSAGVMPTPHTMDIPQANYDTSKPTKYSFTYPTGQGQNGQKTQYFPTQGALDDFLKGVRGASSQAGEGYKTATGYLKKGGFSNKQYMTVRGLQDGNDHGDFDNISPNKARQILHDKKVYGKPLTPEQYRLFGYLSKGNTLKFKRGGFQDIYDFLYEDDTEGTPKEDNIPTAPTTDDLPEESSQQDGESEDDSLALGIAFGDFSSRNPYVESNRQRGVNPYTQQTSNDILSSFDGVTNLGIWGDKAHQQRQSDHNTGDAQDFGVSDPTIGKQIVSKLQNEARDRNVKYIIYNGRIWDPSSNEWKKYNGPDPHTTHIHVSYNR